MLRSKVAFITGAAGCLGSATARKLVNDGFKVLMLDTNAIIGNKIADEIGSNAIFTAGNIISESDVTNAFNIAKEKFGGVNVIVNCAGTYRAHVIFNHQTDSMLHLDEALSDIQVNVGGVLNVLRIGARVLYQNQPDEDGLRGVIINTSGFGATDGQKGQTVLSLIWGALSSMTMPLCREFGSLGIRVMTISPGLFTSDVVDILPPKLVKLLSNMTPFPKRFGQDREYAHLVKAIIDNNFLNGEVVRLDGGLRMSLYS